MRFVSYYPRAVSDTSGVTAALWGWAAALVDAGHQVHVLHAGGPRLSPDPRHARPNLTDEAIPHRGHGRASHRPIGFGRSLRSDDVLILHEGWVMSNAVAARAARRVGCPYIVIPHGVYESGIRATLRQPRFIREIFERPVLEHAAAIHIFFETEEPLVRAVTPKIPPTIVAPNGFEPTAERWTGGGGYLAWIGRYDPVHKGLDLLIGAVARLAPEERPIIELRGPDFNGGHRRTLDLIERHGVGRWVHATGPVSGAPKDELLCRADGYVMPSRWDACPIALIENLAIGAPCLVSDAIHMATPLGVADAAVLAPASEDGLADGLRRLAQADTAAIGDRGRSWVESSLAWPGLAAAFLDGVERVTGRGIATRPPTG
jgi:glycosyltransferase involved in cell wall biosynthesis